MYTKKQLENSNVPKVSIIILNYNAGDLLLDCVNSVLKSTYKNFKILVVDNHSSDNSHLNCKNKFPEIDLLINKENLGYCEGNNTGIRYTDSELIAILNPDTIVEPNWLDELVSEFSNRGDGFYQPKILSVDDSTLIESTGNMMQLFGFGYSRDKGIKDTNSRCDVEEIGFPAGTCFLTSKKILEKLNMFDPFLFLYQDDLDLGWRGLQFKVKSFFVPSSVVYHTDSYNLKWSSKKFYWLERNRKYCLLTHFSRKTIFFMLPSLLIVDFFVFLFYLKKGFPQAKIKADFNLLKNLNKIMSKYNELETNKIIPDKFIIHKFSDEVFLPTGISKNNSENIFMIYFSKLSKITRKFLLKFI